jgi:hypothetical protein
VPSFPDFYLIAALMGWENGAGLVRALVGPAYVQADFDGRTVGVQGRLDAATPALWRVAMVVSIRPTLIPYYRGDMVGLLAVGIGLRLR